MTVIFSIVIQSEAKNLLERHRFMVKFAMQVKFSCGKWSLSMTSEVSPKVKLRWESIQFLCLSLFVPQVRGSLDYARDDGTTLRVDTRVDINPLQDFRYTQKRSICAIALDMPWKGRDGGKSIYFFVCPCLYQKLGDLSTSLEMTFFGDRHFDQVQRVEKSPNLR